MRDPNSLVKSYDLESPPAVIDMHDVPAYEGYDYDLNDEKSFKKYLLSIEKCVRNSFEYKSMVQFLRDYVDMDRCAFYQNISNADSTKIHIEIHHEPLSLFDICLIIYNKRVAFHESLDEEWVAKEVMYYHYNLMVGLIPLAETVHELVHDNYLFVPTTAVYGKYREFVNMFEPYMTPEQLEMLDHIEEATKTYDWDNARDILSKNFIYLNLSDEQKSVEDVVGLVKDRIKDIVDDRDAATGSSKYSSQSALSSTIPQ